MVEKSFGDKAVEVGYKVGGWDLRFKAIGMFITGIILFIFGIIFTFVSGSWGVLIFSLIGIVVIVAGWFSWWRAKSFVKGRYY